MLLSEAIRLGAMLRQQARVTAFDEVKGTCAMGAALEAVGALDAANLPTQWDVVLKTASCRCPDCDEIFRARWVKGGVHGATTRVIWHINDDHLWTRERIADWVERVENEIRSLLEPSKAVVAVGLSVESPITTTRV
jgi:uncharacterized C2H2 Zn-finger protein